MMNPLKLFLLTLGAASALSIAPWLIKQIVPGEVPEKNNNRSLIPISTDAVVAKVVPASRDDHARSVSLLTSGKLVTAEAEKPVVADSTLPVPAMASGGSVAAPPVTTPVSTPAPTPTPTPKPEIPYRAEVARAQELLEKLQYVTGKIDGKLGQKTEAAIIAFQRKSGLPDKGDADATTLAKLEEEVAALPPPAPPEVKPETAPSEIAASETAEPEIASTATVDADKNTDDKSTAEEKTTAVVKKSDSEKVAKADDPQFLILRKPSRTVNADPGPVPSLNKVVDVKRIQEKLVEAKVYANEPDGKWGHLTIVAMKEFQEKNGLKVTGKPNKDTWARLNSPSEEFLAAADSENRSENSRKSDDSDEKPRKLIGASAGIDPVEKKKDSKAGKVEIVDAAKSSGTDTSAISIAIPEKKKTLVEPKVLTSVANPVEIKPAAHVPVAELKVSEPASPGKATSPVTGEADVSVEAKAVLPVSEPVSGTGIPTSPPSGEVVVKLNADAGAPISKVLATPAVVSPEVVKDAPADAKHTNETPALAASSASDTQASPVSGPDVKVKVMAPRRAGVVAAGGNSALEDHEDLPSGGPSGAPANPANLEKEVAEAQARVAMVSNDPRYEIDKYAPKMLETVNGLVEKMRVQGAAAATDPGAAKQNLLQIEQELEKAKQASIRLKAERKVSEVDAVYKTIKSRFADQIKKAPLADLMAKIDNGYDAMKGDFKKGNFDPIVERCDGFKLQIEILANDAAKDYLKDTLEKKTVRGKMDKSTLKSIEELRAKNKYMEASVMLEKAVKAKSASSSRKKS